MPSEIVSVGSANGHKDAGMVALLGPPRYRKVFEVIAVVSDNDTGLLRCEQKLFFVAEPTITSRHGRQAIESVGDKKGCQQNIDIFVQIDTKWNGRH